jgi:DNA-binding CsgD family transcriptional regulator
MPQPVEPTKLVAEIAAIAAAETDQAHRAQALLEPLHRVYPYDAVFVTLFDPERRVQVPVARRGYEPIHRYLDSAAFVDELELASLQRVARPTRVRDLPMTPMELPVWAEHLHPAGFKEGLGGGLFTPDGRYLGLLWCNSCDATPASEATCTLLQQVMPLIAHAVDPLRSIGALADLVADALAGAALTRAGKAEPLPGLAGHAVLVADSPVLAAVDARLCNGSPLVTFLWPAQRQARSGPVLRVTGLACGALPGHLRAIVLLSPAPPLHGLSLRDLQVLGLLIEGHSSADVAAALHVPARTAADVVAKILVKLGSATPAVAAVRALRQGLYLPAELTTRSRRPPCLTEPRSTRYSPPRSRPSPG